MTLDVGLVLGRDDPDGRRGARSRSSGELLTRQGDQRPTADLRNDLRVLTRTVAALAEEKR